MARKLAFRRLWIVVAASVAVMPALLQPLPVAASSTGTLFGIDIRRSALVSIDPTTGATTPVADLSLANQPAPGFMDTMASDPATHRLFLVRNVFDFSNGFPTTSYELVTVDSRGGILTVSPDMGHPVTSLAFDTSTGTLLGFTGDCCPNQIVSINPTSGVLTHIADVIGDSFSSVAFSPTTHSLYVDSESFAAPPPNPPINTLLVVDTTQTDHVTIGPMLNPGVNSLAFDTSLGALFGVTFFPPHFVSVNTTTGVETSLGTYDFGFFLEPGTAIDPATHTFFKVQDVFDDPMGPIAHIASINDQTGAGVLGGTTGTNLAAIVFEPVLITPESIKADVRAALSSGAITNAGIANSLLAKLNAAGDARSSGHCATASNIYNAFINELKAQSGNQVTAATASQLISEARFLIANCP